MMTSTITQPGVLLGEIAPDFIAQTTQGQLEFHKWLGNSWCVFFSHPKGFTPVCTTELGMAAKLELEFAKRHTKIIALSVDSLEHHQAWIKDIEVTQNVKIYYPLIADSSHAISEAYGMIHPAAMENSTVRCVFLIDPHKKIRLALTYPASTGRNFQEILRALDSIQLTDQYPIATPANWEWGKECVITTAVKDPKPEQFPKGWKDIRPYLRLTPQPGPETPQK